MNEVAVNAGQPVIDIDLSLRRAASLCPDKLAVADSTRRLSWAEFDARINQVANALIARGLQPNDRLAILGRN